MRAAYWQLFESVDSNDREAKEEIMKPFVTWFLEREEAYLSQLASTGRAGKQVARVTMEISRLVSSLDLQR